MANYDNIKDKGFDKRSTEELRAIQKKGGINSGKSRKKKANLKKAMNAVLTSRINDPKVERILEEFGLDPTFENALVLKVANKAISKGDIKAYNAIMDTLGRKDSDDKKEQKARIKHIEARTEKLNNDNTEVEYLDDVEGDVYGDH